MSTLTDCEDDGAGSDVAGNDCDQLDMIGPTIYYDTPDPGSTGYYAAYCRVHRMGDEPDWGKWEYDDDDDGAGNDCDQIDMIELTIERC